MSEIRPANTIARISHALRSIWRQGMRSATDLAFPPACRLCSRPFADSPADFCEPCSAHLAHQRESPYCPTCGSTVAPFELSDDRCRECRHRRPKITGTVRVGRYDGGMATLVKAYKYDDRAELGPAFASWMVERVRSATWLSRVEAIVPVPTHWRRRIGRDCYPPDELARAVSIATGMPIAPILRRVKAGPHQIGLNYQQRVENIRGAFALTRGTKLTEARLLIIDDVKTTGATLDECAKVLQRGGAGELYAAVLTKASADGSIRLDVRNNDAMNVTESATT